MSERQAEGDQFADDDEPTRGPRLAHLIAKHIRAALANGAVHVAIPASVAKVHTDGAGNVTQVDLAPGVHDFHRDEGGALIVDSLPIVSNVPVGIPGAGGVRLTLPIQVGDLGHLSFFDRSIDRWLSGEGKAVDPELYARFNLTDALFTPGLRPFGSPWQSWPSDHATLGTDGAEDGHHTKLHFHPDFICAGDEAGSKAVGLDGDDSDGGMILFTPNVPPAGAASISYIAPPGPYPPPAPPVVQLRLSAKLSASAAQLKAK